MGNLNDDIIERDLAEGSFIAKWPNWLRWLLFLPASIIGPFLFSILQSITNNWFLDIGSDAFYLILIRGITYGAGFVFCGTCVAPKYQKAIAVILLITLSVFSGIGLLSAIQLGSPLTHSIEIIIMLISGGYTTFYIFHDK